MISFLTNSKNIKRDAVLWNAIAAVMNSFQTMLILLIITHGGTDKDSSIFVMAYAVGNLMINVGKYGVRQFQVTDVKEKYSFSDYLTSRWISCLFMILCSLAYCGVNFFRGAYTTEKTLIVLIICLVKLVEAFEDVYQGRMQQKGRLDVAGKILGIRLFVFIVIYTVLFLVTKNLLLTSAISFVITLIMAFWMNGSVSKMFEADSFMSFGKGNSFKLLIDCLPLCICMCLNMYIANSPKYTIDTAVSDEVQTRFNIVFMPVFIIALMANFIFQPMLKNVGEMWVENKTSELANKIAKLSILVIALSAVITFVGSFIGNPILGLVYGVDLSKYDLILIIFMMAGGIIAIQNLFIMIITTVRYQKYMIYGYAFTALIMVLFSGRVHDKFKLTGLCWFFLAMLIVLTLYCLALIVVAFKKKNRK